ncbi:MAG: Rieske 2Fe-2S domain-containing protein [Rhodospirillales bacterium]|nr:Rieske 2Fe-2S domain-containing protein [Rhodospirillales bacterium]
MRGGQKYPSFFTAKTLSEQLIAFRDTSGRVGIMDHRCPHRCASFFFARNEKNGIRCVYHGWKFGVGGNCLDMANLPPHQDFRDKVKAKAYKAQERSGVVWVFMGDQKNIPPLPQIEATMAPEEDVELLFIQRECNWLQGAEGELDTSHLGVLHFGSVGKDSFTEKTMDQYVVSNRAPEYKVEETGFGQMYAAYRPGGEGETYWRIGHFLFPCWTMPPICPISTNILARAYVPMDDTHTMMVYLIHRQVEMPGERPGRKPIVGGGVWRFEPNTTAWHGRYGLKDHKDNDYNIDREIQRTQSYTGITGINLQDQAVSESMGEITDMTFEHLGPSDVMVSRTRRQLIRAALAFEKDGTLPPSAADPMVYTGVRGGQFLAPEKMEWLEAYAQQIENAPLKV